jgi:hypothetical protein
MPWILGYEKFNLFFKVKIGVSRARNLPSFANQHFEGSSIRQIRQFELYMLIVELKQVYYMFI